MISQIHPLFFVTILGPDFVARKVYPFTGELGNTHAVPPTPDWGGGGRGVGGTLALRKTQILCKSQNSCMEMSLIHSKNTWVSVNREGVYIGAKLHSVNMTWNMTHSWVNLTPFFVKSVENWPNSWSLLTRKGVWPQWTFSPVTLTRVL